MSESMSIERTAQSIQEAITRVVRERGWSLTQLPGKLIWTLSLSGYRCYIQVEPEESRTILYGIVPTTVPENARAAAAVALAGINYGLAVGKFELDLDDGELRFSNGIDVRGTVLDPVVYARMVDHTIEMLDAYSPALVAGVKEAAGG